MGRTKEQNKEYMRNYRISHTPVTLVTPVTPVTHDFLMHQRRMKSVHRQYWKQADYAIHVYKLKQSLEQFIAPTPEVDECLPQNS